MPLWFFDVLVTPTTPVPPYTIADLQSDPAAERPKEVRMLRNTRPFNMLGMPTISSVWIHAIRSSGRHATYRHVG
jgi:Asp-tRNA(Asn)/Glu-tRNA(Gln) amidotransferase A subunit family amidase